MIKLNDENIRKYVYFATDLFLLACSISLAKLDMTNPTSLSTSTRRCLFFILSDSFFGSHGENNARKMGYVHIISCNVYDCNKLFSGSMRNVLRLLQHLDSDGLRLDTDSLLSEPIFVPVKFDAVAAAAQDDFNQSNDAEESLCEQDS